MNIRRSIGMLTLITLTGCAYAPAAPPPAGVPVDYYGAYYDGYYGPFVDGYWGDDGGFWYADHDHHWHRDAGTHFRHEAVSHFARVQGTGMRREH